MTLMIDIILWGGAIVVVIGAVMFAKDAWDGIRIYKHDRLFTEKAIEEASDPQTALLLRELFNRRYPRRKIE